MIPYYLFYILLKISTIRYYIFGILHVIFVMHIIIQTHLAPYSMSFASLMKCIGLYIRYDSQCYDRQRHRKT